MKKMALVGTIALILLATVAFAAGPGHGRGGKGSGAGGRGASTDPAVLARELNLDETQQAQLESVFSDLRHTRTSLRIEAQQLRAELDQELATDAPDAAAVDELTSAIAANHTKMVQSRTGMMLELKSILSPEQMARFEELRQERRPDMRQGKRGHGGRGNSHGGHGQGGMRGQGGQRGSCSQPGMGSWEDPSFDDEFAL